MERDCESELSKLNIEQNACIYHFGASVIHGQRSNILRLLLKDDLSNETLAYGLHAWKQDGCIHEGIEGFLKEKEPVRLTLRTLGELSNVTAQQWEIYVVENPSVFSVLTSRNPACAAVCIN